MLPSFTPTRFNGAFETWDLEQLMHAAITHRVGGDWWVSVSRPSDKGYLEVSGVIENVQSDLIRALKTGSLQTFVHMPGDDLFYRVSPAIWDSKDADGYLGVTKGYELIGAGELDVIKIGRATRITVASINAMVARRRAEQQRAA